MQIRRLLAVLPLLACFSAFAGDAEDIQLLLKNKQYPQALERADKFIASNPKDAQIAQVRFLKGIIQTEIGQPNEAIKTFSALANDYPQLPEPYNNLAVLYAQQNQLDKARSALQMAIQTNPSYAIAHENLGDLYARLASQSYDKALQLENNNPNVQTKLTLVRELFSKTPQIATSGKQAVTTPAPAGKPATPPAPPASKPLPPPVATPVAPAVVPPPKPATPPAPVVKPVTPPAPAQTAATKAAPPAPPATDNNDKAKIIAVVNGWADAWSHKNVNDYLAVYARDYHPPGGQKYSDWAKDRRDRINAPKSIEVKLSEIKVEMVDDNSAKVHFRQSYRSDRLSSSTGKTLVLLKTGGRWLINEERTGN